MGYTMMVPRWTLWLGWLAWLLWRLVDGAVDLAPKWPPDFSETRSRAIETAPAPPESETAPAPGVQTIGLSTAKEDLQQFLGENCAACHGTERNRVASDLEVLDLECLVDKGYVVPGQKSQSRVWLRVRDGEMPPPQSQPLGGQRSIQLASYVDGYQPPDSKDIVTVIESDDRLTFVVQLLKTSNLLEALRVPGKLTIFAPTNEAFAEMPEITRKALLQKNNDSVQRILFNHAVPGVELSVKQLGGLGKVISADGGELTIKRHPESGRLWIGDENAIVVVEDIYCTNGVIHLINRVLVPHGVIPRIDPKAPPHKYITRNGIEMVEIREGEFTMGTPPPWNQQTEKEGPQRKVRISTFYLASHETTGDQYLAVMGKGPASDGPWARTLAAGVPQGVVRWVQAVEFCNKLSALEGLTAYYDIQDVGGRRIVTVPDPDGNGYRLPTEAEWEYASRAGSKADYCFGNTVSLLEQYAWHRGNATAPNRICMRKANAFHLYDMHGNVAEWCQDWYGPYSEQLGEGTLIDPRGPLTGRLRVYRGGSYARGADDCRSAARFPVGEVFQHIGVGFRIARTPHRGEPIPLLTPGQNGD